jgi:hypothetical protein
MNTTLTFMTIIFMWNEDCHILYICPLYSLYLKHTGNMNYGQ